MNQNPKRLLPVETPTINGRIYSQEIANAIIEQINTTQVFVTADTPETLTIPFDRLAGYAKNARTEDGWVVFDYHSAKTPMGIMIDTLLGYEVSLDFVTCGKGTLSKDLVVSDYEFMCVAAVARPVHQLEERDK